MSQKLWKQLSKISTFTFTSHCRKIPPSYERRKGRGEVKIENSNEEIITFFEKGKWQGIRSKEPIAFTNVFRWRLNNEKNNLSLEHLRFGEDHPVFLFTLEQVGGNLFKSLKPYECKDDVYFASLLFDDHYIHLNWRIMGTKKNELVNVVYSRNTLLIGL